MLILGTSHVGKTRLATDLGAALGWPVVGTDTLARHPGRPWADAPPPVLEHFIALSEEAILWFLRTHHDNLRHRVSQVLARPGSQIVEGAALRPEYLAEWGVPAERALCLFSDPEVLRARIMAASRYEGQPTFVKRAIKGFVARSLAENTALAEAARAAGIACVDTSEFSRMPDVLASWQARLSS